MNFLKVARDDANLVSLFSSFHNFAPRYENAFWPVLVLSRGICKFVSVKMREFCFCHAQISTGSPGYNNYAASSISIRHIVD